jgi:hypothetical protein
MWQDVESWFKNQMKTGIITNLAYKDSKILKKKSFKIFSNRINAQLSKFLIKEYSLNQGVEKPHINSSPQKTVV